MKRHPHELYNTHTEQVEETETMTSQEAVERNETFYFNEEPRRWMAVSQPKGNGEIIQRLQPTPEPDGNILWA